MSANKCSCKKTLVNNLKNHELWQEPVRLEFQQ